MTYYTRAGNLYLDEEGNLVNSDGLYVLDTNENRINFASEVGGGDQWVNNMESFSIGADGSINIINANGALVANTPSIGLAKFSNAEGLEKAGDNLYTVSANSGNPQITAPGENGAGVLVAG